MRKVFTLQDAQKVYAQYGFKLLETEYKNNSTRMKCEDKDGYWYYTNLNNISKHKCHRIADVRNPYALHNIQTFINKFDSKCKVLTTRWVNCRDELKLECGCGNIFYKKWSEIWRGKLCLCPNCKKLRGSLKRLDFDFVKDEFFRLRKYFVLDKQYVGNNQRLLCLDEQGYKVKVNYSNIQGNYTKHPYRFSVKFNRENYIYNVNHYFDLHNINCIALNLTGQKQGTADVIRCMCECGKYFTTTMDSIKTGQVRCPKCSHSVSKAEYKMIKWLDENKIDYIYQYRNENCRHKRKLPFDFYFPKLNLMIEVDGSQHHKAAPFGGWDTAEQNLKDTQMRDGIKNQFCQDTGIHLIRIPTSKFRYGAYIKLLSNLFFPSSDRNVT